MIFEVLPANKSAISDYKNPELIVKYIYQFFWEVFTMKKYQCVCGYIYDPEIGDPDNGSAPGTAFEDLPEDWTCPVCGAGKALFSPVD